MLLFLFSHSEASCVGLEVKLHSDSRVSEEQIRTAVEFGMDISNLGNPIDTKKFVFSFIRNLLLQSAKFHLGIQSSTRYRY